MINDYLIEQHSYWSEKLGREKALLESSKEMSRLKKENLKLKRTIDILWDKLERGGKIEPDE